MMILILFELTSLNLQLNSITKLGEDVLKEARAKAYELLKKIKE